MRTPRPPPPPPPATFRCRYARRDAVVYACCCHTPCSRAAAMICRSRRAPRHAASSSARHKRATPAVATRDTPRMPYHALHYIRPPVRAAIYEAILPRALAQRYAPQRMAPWHALCARARGKKGARARALRSAICFTRHNHAPCAAWRCQRNAACTLRTTCAVTPYASAAPRHTPCHYFTPYMPPRRLAIIIAVTPLRYAMRRKSSSSGNACARRALRHNERDMRTRAARARYCLRRYLRHTRHTPQRRHAIRARMQRYATQCHAKCASRYVTPRCQRHTHYLCHTRAAEMRACHTMSCYLCHATPCHVYLCCCFRRGAE